MKLTPLGYVVAALLVAVAAVALVMLAPRSECVHASGAICAPFP